jgi:hypothetical protein
MKIAGESEEVSGPHREGAGDPANGELVPTAEVQLRLKTFGPNDTATVKCSPLWLQFLARLKSAGYHPPRASGLSAATDDIASFIIVVSIVMISITLDFVQEVRAQNAVEALRRCVAVQTTVRFATFSSTRLTSPESPYPAEKQARDAVFGAETQLRRRTPYLPAPIWRRGLRKAASRRFCGRRSPHRHADHAPHRFNGALRPNAEHLVSSASA